jgi:hypothetical protein
LSIERYIFSTAIKNGVIPIPFKSIATILACEDVIALISNKKWKVSADARSIAFYGCQQFDPDDDEDAQNHYSS